MAIARYTVLQFGREQVKSYGAGLLETLDALAEYPLMGSDQGHIRPALRRHVYKSHTIYYRPERNGVVVQRILGPGQDPLREL
jgi:toxin ParE1/3/4